MPNTLDKLSDEGQLIALGSSRETQFVRQLDIAYLQSESCYTKVYLTDNTCFVMCRTLKNYESILNRKLFFRCHRSFLVNRYFVKGIIRQDCERLVLKSGIHIPIARRKIVDLKKLMIPVTTFGTDK